MTARHAVRVAKKVGLYDGIQRARERLSPDLRRLRQNRIAFYRQFVKPGSLCFDIGANVGNRVEVFLQLGAQVVAVEPQPACVAELRRRFGRSGDVTILPIGLAADEGQRTLYLSSTYHPVSTMSDVFMRKTKEAGRFTDATWTAGTEVKVSTLDRLISIMGPPDFCKIDVEGSEHEVLEGLSRALPALSFEYTVEILELAEMCICRLAQLGEYEYNFSRGESMSWAGSWTDGERLLATLKTFTVGEEWGDVYARELR